MLDDEVCHIVFDCMAFDLDWNDAHVPGGYFESWLDNPNSCLLFTVSGVGEKSAILLYVTVLFLIPCIWQGTFFSGYWFQIVFPCLVICHIWWSYEGIWNSNCYSKLECCYSQSCHRWPVCCVQLCCGGLYRCFETALYSLVCGISDERYGCSWIYKSLVAFACVYHFCGAIHDECHYHLVTWR